MKLTQKTSKGKTTKGDTYLREERKKLRRIRRKAHALYEYKERCLLLWSLRFCFKFYSFLEDASIALLGVP